MLVNGEPLEDLVLGNVLEARAESHRDETFLKFHHGELTFGEVDTAANRVAQGLAATGVDRGDHVAVMLPNGAEFLYAIFALAKLGAVAVPVNTAYKGELLHHVLATSDASLIVIDESCTEHLPSITGRLGGLDGIVVRGDEIGDASLERLGKPARRFDQLLDHGDEPLRADVGFGDTQAIMYTSGTTGPAKGAITPHATALTCALDSLRFVSGGSDTIYCPLPLFHAAGLWDGMMAALYSGGSLAVVERFSASRFWDDVRHFGAQTAMGVFSMIPILLNQPPRPDDLDNPLETFYMGKSALDDAFFERFGAHTVETYTSTEAGIPLASPYGEWRDRSCGQVHHERFEAAVVDEWDRPVGPGEPGELVLRPKQPHVLVSGYYGFAEATADTFRNAWFHTGDRLRYDDDGYFYFIDRMKDSIRRRGESISAFDLECAVNLHPAVLESAAIGVPSKWEEEDVKVAVVLQPGAELAPAELAAYCRERLPQFMVPRYIEFVDELPRTATDKIAKHKLRATGNHGITPGTWDHDGADVDTARVSS